jgi:3D (Asp-Asp-Asp) domain-containing protein
MKYVLMTKLLAHADAVSAAPYEMPIVLKEEPAPVAIVEQAVAEPKWLTFEITAYTANAESTGKSPGDAGYGITASGEPVRANYTTACPKSLPFGTRLEIEGLGERVCTDRGGAIGEGRLDVYMAELNDALDFGRQSRQVRIIE